MDFETKLHIDLPKERNDLNRFLLKMFYDIGFEYGFSQEQIDSMEFNQHVLETGDPSHKVLLEMHGPRLKQYQQKMQTFDEFRDYKLELLNHGVRDGDTYIDENGESLTFMGIIIPLDWQDTFSKSIYFKKIVRLKKVSLKCKFDSIRQRLEYYTIIYVIEKDLNVSTLET